MFWILTAALFTSAMLFVLVPLLRKSDLSEDGEKVRNEANISLFKEREQELEAELAAKSIDVKQFNSLLIELKQNLLSDVVDESDQSIPSRRIKKTQGKRLTNNKRAQEKFLTWNIGFPILLTFLIPLLAYSLYDRWGYIDEVEMMDLYQRTVQNVDDLEEAQALIVSLGQAVQEDDGQPWAWYFLAENFSNIGMFNEAEIAYARSADLFEATPEKALVLGRVAMVKYINADLQLTPEVTGVIDEARAINPNEITILQLLASDASSNEDYVNAISYWRLLIQADPNSQQAQTLRANITAAQRILAQQSPSSEDGPVIDVTVSLADDLELNSSLRVFIAARNADREGMPPLAAIDLVVGNLPMTVRLDNSSAVGPFNLASAENVYVSVLVSQAGIAAPQPGDYRVVSESFSHNNEQAEISLIISETVN
ncbi:MAG: c-type cytochrome biogenesis protein CcmI [Pseudohongiellaceae bacterium]